MTQFKTSLALFMAWFGSVPGRSEAIAPDANLVPPPDQLDPVKLQPLNRPGDNLFAAHRSHSSHRSHASSSGGGGAYRAPTPQPQDSPQRSPSDTSSLYDSGTNRPTDLGRPSQVSPAPAQSAPKLSIDEKRRLQIMRVQIALTSLGLYEGQISGELDSGTKASLQIFQHLKGIEKSGLMTDETLNALGVPAVR